MAIDSSEHFVLCLRPVQNGGQGEHAQHGWCHSRQAHEHHSVLSMRSHLLLVFREEDRLQET